MTPEEIAARHCLNGHDPVRCQLLGEVRQAVAEERERCAKIVEELANKWIFSEPGELSPEFWPNVIRLNQPIIENHGQK